MADTRGFRNAPAKRSGDGASLPAARHDASAFTNYPVATTASPAGAALWLCPNPAPSEAKRVALRSPTRSKAAAAASRESLIFGTRC